MKNYRITVNGNTYDVQVEELEESEVSAGAVQSTNTVHNAAPARASEPSPVIPAREVVGGTPVNAPMPGTVLDIKVKLGDSVKANQVVIVLEAMKMENEIVTPAAGKVTAINVTSGQAVNSGDVLIVVA